MSLDISRRKDLIQEIRSWKTLGEGERSRSWRNCWNIGFDINYHCHKPVARMLLLLVVHWTWPWLPPIMKVVIRHWSVESSHRILWVCQNLSPINTAGIWPLSHFCLLNLLWIYVLLQTLISFRTQKAVFWEIHFEPDITCNSWVIYKVWRMPPYLMSCLNLVSLIPLFCIVYICIIFFLCPL